MVGKRFIANSGKEFTLYGLPEKHRPVGSVLVLSTADVPVETGLVLSGGRKQEMLDFTRQIEYSIVDAKTGDAYSDGDFLNTDAVSKGFHRANLDIVDSSGKTPYLSMGITYSDGTDLFSSKMVTFSGRVSDVYPASPGNETSGALFPAFLECFESEAGLAGFSLKAQGNGYVKSYSFEEGPAPTKAEMEKLVSRSATRALFNYLNDSSSEGREIAYSPKSISPIA